jgi:hypothetical protein
MSKIKELELKEFDADGLTDTYQNFGSALSNPGIEITLSNDSDVDAYITKDGSSNWIRIRANSTITFGDTTDTRNVSDEYVLKKGAQLKIKQVTGAGAADKAIVAHVVTRRL